MVKTWQKKLKISCLWLLGKYYKICNFSLKLGQTHVLQYFLAPLWFRHCSRRIIESVAIIWHKFATTIFLFYKFQTLINYKNTFISKMPNFRFKFQILFRESYVELTNRFFVCKYWFVKILTIFLNF